MRFSAVQCGSGSVKPVPNALGFMTYLLVVGHIPYDHMKCTDEVAVPEGWTGLSVSCQVVFEREARYGG